MVERYIGLKVESLDCRYETSFKYIYIGNRGVDRLADELIVRYVKLCMYLFMGEI